jgi:hypothetical protein
MKTAITLLFASLSFSSAFADDKLIAECGDWEVKSLGDETTYVAGIKMSQSFVTIGRKHGVALEAGIKMTDSYGGTATIGSGDFEVRNNLAQWKVVFTAELNKMSLKVSNDGEATQTIECKKPFPNKVPYCFSDHSKVDDGLYYVSIPYAHRTAQDIGQIIQAVSTYSDSRIFSSHVIGLQNEDEYHGIRSFTSTGYTIRFNAPTREAFAKIQDTSFPTYISVEEKAVEILEGLFGDMEDVSITCQAKSKPHGD